MKEIQNVVQKLPRGQESAAGSGGGSGGGGSVGTGTKTLKSSPVYRGDSNIRKQTWKRKVLEDDYKDSDDTFPGNVFPSKTKTMIISPQIQKDWVIYTFHVVALELLNDPSTWLNVATT